MYITLFHPDPTLNILTMNFLRSKNVDFIYKNQYFFLEEATYEKLVGMYRDFYIHSIEPTDPQVRYLFYANELPYTALKRSHLFEGYQKQPFQSADSFAAPRSRYLFNGGMISLFFAGPLISNPLDLLWRLATQNSYQQNYHAVFYDFLPITDQIIYQIGFNFTGRDLGAKLKEILGTKVGIHQKRIIFDQSKPNGFPDIYKAFQSEYLAKNLKSEECTLHFQDSTLYLPETEANLQRLQLRLEQV